MGTLPAVITPAKSLIPYTLSSQHSPYGNGDGEAIDRRGGPGTSHPLIVLLVDDEPDNLDVLRWFLRDEGFEVRTAANSPAALRSVQARVPDLAIIDYMMPGMNGIALCHRLREKPATQHLPIILHTAADLVRIAEPIPDLCVDRVVAKPGDAQGLVREVRALLNITH